MSEKNTKELAEVLGRTHLSEFDKYCNENNYHLRLESYRGMALGIMLLHIHQTR